MGSGVLAQKARPATMESAAHVRASVKQPAYRIAFRKIAQPDLSFRLPARREGNTSVAGSAAGSGPLTIKMSDPMSQHVLVLPERRTAMTSAGPPVCGSYRYTNACSYGRRCLAH